MLDQPSICDLGTGDVLVGYFLATDAAYKTTRTGSEYLELKLADASGELKAFLWDLKAVEGEYSDLVPDVFVKVKGRVEEFQGRKQIRVDKIRFAPDSEVGDFSRFFPTSRRNVDEMLQELDGLVQSVGDPWIRRLLEAMFVQDAERRADFAKAPAAKSMHHVYLGGLLEHTLSVADMARRACEHYTDLVLAGVLLHDLGKTAELSYQRSFGYTDTGNLLGHITLEAQWVSKAVDAIPGFPEELRLQILHIVLAHHGKLEFGSPVLPKTPEALLVHYLDDLDGKLEGMFRLMHEESGQGNWSAWSRALDRPVYRVRWPNSL